MRRPLLLALFALLACGETGAQLQQQIGERLQQQLTSTDKKRPEEPDRLPPELVTGKLSLYATCLSSTRVSLYDGFRRVGAAFTGKGREAPDPVPPEALAECSKAGREAPLLQPPMLELDRAVVAYEAAARALAEALDAVREDMSQKTPSIKEGEASPLFARVEAAYQTWDGAREALSAEIDARQARLDDELLAKIEARAGKGIEWHSRRAMFAARPFDRCLTEHDEFTARVCEGHHTAFRAAYADFRAALAAGTPGDVFWLPQFSESLEEFARAADALADALAANKADAEAIGAVSREYADALRDSESLNFARASR